MEKIRERKKKKKGKKKSIISTLISRIQGNNGRKEEGERRIRKKRVGAEHNTAIQSKGKKKRIKERDNNVDLTMTMSLHVRWLRIYGHKCKWEENRK